MWGSATTAHPMPQAKGPGERSAAPFLHSSLSRNATAFSTLHCPTSLSQMRARFESKVEELGRGVSATV